MQAMNFSKSCPGGKELREKIIKLKEEDPTRLKKAIIQVQHNGRPARLLLNKRPSATGFAWLKYDDDGEEFEDDLAKVTLVALIEA